MGSRKCAENLHGLRINNNWQVFQPQVSWIWTVQLRKNGLWEYQTVLNLFLILALSLPYLISELLSKCTNIHAVRANFFHKENNSVLRQFSFPFIFINFLTMLLTIM